MCECESVNPKSLLRLWGIAYFYIVIILGIFKFCDFTEVNGVEDYVYILFPMTKGRYWYLVCYSFVFLLIPYINKLIVNLSNAKFKNLIVSIIILTSLLPTLGMTDFFRMNNGYSPSWLIVCYLLGAYIKKYSIALSLKYKCVIMLLNAVLGTVFSVVIRHFWSDTMSILFDGYSSLLLVQYISPLIVINSILAVSIFSEINWIKNSYLGSVIQKISVSTFGVYVLHIHVLLYDHYMKDAFVETVRNNPISMCIMIIKIIVGIFMACCIIEIIRGEIVRGIVRIHKNFHG